MASAVDHPSGIRPLFDMLNLRLEIRAIFEKKLKIFGASCSELGVTIAVSSARAYTSESPPSLGQIPVINKNAG